MKIRLGSRTIKLSRISKVTVAGTHLANITFVTGESILVIGKHSKPELNQK